MSRSSRQRVLPGVLLLVLAAVALFVASSASGKAGAGPPVAKTEPSISGTPLEGNTLTGDKGEWTGAGITFTYQWLRCDANAANCQPIQGANTTTYKLVSADLGSTVRFQVTGKNAGGSTVKQSNPTGLVTTNNGAPASSKPPTISGTPVVGNDLTAATGTWVGDTPITYSYQWLRCDNAGNACKNADKGTQATYRVVKGDVGKTMRVKVTAKNAKGKSSAISDATAVVQDVSGSGVITLPDGTKSVPVADVPSDQRLIVDTVRFTPNPVTSRQTSIKVEIRVKDTRGYAVRDAYVFIRSTPLLTSTPTDQQTATDGWVTYHIQPQSNFPLKTGYNVQFFVKAYRKTDKTLYGVYGSRLVQVATKG